MRNVAADAVLQRFSFNIFNRISVFAVVGINGEVKWQAGQGGTHLAISHKIPLRDFLLNLLVGEYPQSPLNTQ